jgi:hypothetical protein
LISNAALKFENQDSTSALSFVTLTVITDHGKPNQAFFERNASGCRRGKSGLARPSQGEG